MKTFKEAFCEFFHCPPEHYLREAFRRTLHLRARFFWPLLYWYRELLCVELLENVGETTSEGELQDLVDEFEYDVNVRGGVLAKRWKLRVSGQRLLELHRLIRNTT